MAAVLAEWNPLRSRADSVSDLDGYRIEAIDIIMALGVFRRSNRVRYKSILVDKESYLMEICSSIVLNPVWAKMLKGAEQDVLKEFKLKN